MDNPASRERANQDAARAKEKKKFDELGTDGGSDRIPDVPAPFTPNSDEESPLGDTDEHSDA